MQNYFKVIFDQILNSYTFSNDHVFILEVEIW